LYSFPWFVGAHILTQTAGPVASGTRFFKRRKQRDAGRSFPLSSCQLSAISGSMRRSTAVCQGGIGRLRAFTGDGDVGPWPLKQGRAADNLFETDSHPRRLALCASMCSATRDVALGPSGRPGVIPRSFYPQLGRAANAISEGRELSSPAARRGLKTAPYRPLAIPLSSGVGSTLSDLRENAGSGLRSEA
jgi:hypothetical protein